MTPAELARKLHNLIPSAKRDAMQRAVLVVEAVAKRETPVSTGHLRRSITGRVERGGRRGVVGTNVVYARVVHEGRGPVVAKRARALRIPLRTGVIYRRRVGPARGNPFLTRALHIARPQVERELARWGDQVFGRLR